MFVSYKWLEEYVNLDGMTPEMLAEKITRSGIEVEGVEYKGEGIKGVVIGHVLEREATSERRQIKQVSRRYRR